MSFSALRPSPFDEIMILSVSVSTLIRPPKRLAMPATADSDRCMFSRPIFGSETIHQQEISRNTKVWKISYMVLTISVIGLRLRSRVSWFRCNWPEKAPEKHEESTYSMKQGDRLLSPELHPFLGIQRPDKHVGRRTYDGRDNAERYEGIFWRHVCHTKNRLHSND